MKLEIAPFLRSVLAEGSPVLIVLAGSNGSGKSTFFNTFLFPTGITFINADEIARAVWGPAAAVHAYHAAALADVVRRDLVSRRESFCMETVLSDPAGDKLNFFREAQGAGYSVVLVSVRISGVELSKARVQQRVDEGGHDVPDEKLEERFSRTTTNVAAALTFVDLGLVFDNSSSDEPFRLLELWRRGEMMPIEAPALPFDLTHDAETGLINRRFLERHIAGHLTAPGKHRACLAIIKFSDRQMRAPSRSTFISAMKRSASLFNKHFAGEKVVARLDDSTIGVLLYDATRDEAVGIVRAISDLLSNAQTNPRASVIDVRWPYQVAESVIDDAIALCGPVKKSPRARVVSVLPTRQVQEASARALARRLEVRRAIEAGSVLFEIRPIESSGNSETFFADDIRPCLSIGDDQRLETAEIMVAAQEDQDLGRRICSEMVSAALIRLQARQMNSVEHGVVIHCPACGLDGIREASDLWDQFVTAAATGVPFWVNFSLDFLHEGISTSIKQLHSVGVRFATSLGVGAGSLQQLRQLPFDLLYIEESFVREIETDKNDEAIVMAIASLGESLGLKCVAEGVRAASTRNRLAELGVQLVIPYDDP